MLSLLILFRRSVKTSLCCFFLKCYLFIVSIIHVIYLTLINFYLFFVLNSSTPNYYSLFFLAAFLKRWDLFILVLNQQLIKNSKKLNSFNLFLFIFSIAFKNFNKAFLNRYRRFCVRQESYRSVKYFFLLKCPVSFWLCAQWSC